ncbi:nuclear transport factor 2 family protein [Roseateles sp.]|uniref:nuclear transport factor 2 family protein n=1 Tax=Roseateles sp. TaxID=1971397 RepID=UPI0025F54532|nr:nuclear transport factor 2 family protein [Roseateles sp.]MBV8036390.1 nuclear transport factor 2 family protein [Roseateles sp.]
MDLALPPPVADYFKAEACSETNALGRCFSDDAVVHDEGKAHRGLEAIKAWKVAAKRKYRYRVEPLCSQPVAHGVQVWARLTGDFPGSPVELRYDFQLGQDGIVALEIHA